MMENVRIGRQETDTVGPGPGGERLDWRKVEREFHKAVREGGVRGIKVLRSGPRGSVRAELIAVGAKILRSVQFVTGAITLRAEPVKNSTAQAGKAHRHRGVKFFSGTQGTEILGIACEQIIYENRIPPDAAKTIVFRCE